VKSRIIDEYKLNQESEVMINKATNSSNNKSNDQTFFKNETRVFVAFRKLEFRIARGMHTRVKF
jgi:hypothetical protein